MNGAKKKSEGGRYFFCQAISFDLQFVKVGTKPSLMIPYELMQGKLSNVR